MILNRRKDGWVLSICNIQIKLAYILTRLRLVVLLRITHRSRRYKL